MNIKGKLFHSFGPAAKKVQSPTFVQSPTLGSEHWSRFNFS